MAEYHITTLMNDGRRTDFVIKKQRPAAQYAYRNAVYDAIKALAGLDTLWGHKARVDAETLLLQEKNGTTEINDGYYKVLFERVS